MSMCPYAGECAFFNDRLADMPAVAESQKRRYCRADYESCARYRVRKETGVSPPDLWPDEAERVEEFVSSAGG